MRWLEVKNLWYVRAKGSIPTNPSEVPRSYSQLITSGGIGRRAGVESRGGYTSQVYLCKVQILTSH